MMNIKFIDPLLLNPYKNNPRHNDEAVTAVMESIRQFGFKVPITVDNDYVVVTGHTRLKEVQATVIDEDKPRKSEYHPTMKPIRLIGRQINNSTKPRGLVLDPFGGSGSTLVAAEQLNRTCYMMELDPKYADVIIKRYEDLTGNKAKLVYGGEEDETF